MTWLFLSLLLPAASFDIDRGLVVETMMGSSFLDREDKPGLNTGLRASYSFANQADAFITVEVEGQYDRIFKDEVKSRWTGGLNLAFYEFYTPYAFRFAVGGLVERRLGEISPGLLYRFGLGYYWTSYFGTYLDYATRTIAREEETSFTNQAQLSLQLIF